jgi:hypothetical protein
MIASRERARRRLRELSHSRLPEGYERAVRVRTFMLETRSRRGRRRLAFAELDPGSRVHLHGRDDFMEY